MRPSVWGMFAVAALCLTPGLADAIVYGGGGGPTSDCLAVFDGDINYPSSRPKKIRCADGDACDLDGEANGICEFAVAVCANSTFDPRCTVAGVDEITVDHALDNGDPKFDPDFQALQDRIGSQIEPPNSELDKCTSPSTIRVPIRGPYGSGSCKKGSKKLKLTTESIILPGGTVYRDTDRLTLICDPPADCSPGNLFDGTFHRIQEQVFNQSCALSSCHDSQSHRGGLILEENIAYDQIVDVSPTNATASGFGWKRIDGLGASPEASFVFHKVTGDLGTGLGARMPFQRAKLPSFLIDILELWIEAGAPETGWVAGTD